MALSPQTANTIAPDDVQDILSEHMLVRGMMPMVLGMEESRGVRLVDERTGDEYIDFFGFYASSPLGMNHPKMTSDPDFMQRLTDAALNKITNSDVRTQSMARFVQTFGRVGIPDYLPYTFFISGGALAVENALKAAFDWKVRKNFEKGYRREVGHQVLHMDRAFHGRSGYTMSLTNTADPRKTMYYPKFDWPRMHNPALNFPMTDQEMARVEQQEEKALRQAKRHFRERRDDIAAFIMEPIQGEGGDNHFRPAFLNKLRDLVHENDALFIFDEVQTGVGITGDFWAHQTLGVEPDIIAFGKKTQVCGILAGRKLDEVEGHVFQTPSRINSTWGGNLVDMVRFDRILEVIEEEDLVSHAAEVGAHLLERLHGIAEDHGAMTNVRGRGLMCAFDLPSTGFRADFLDRCYDMGVIILGCGERAVRFRPPLTITTDEVDEGLDLLTRTLAATEEAHGTSGEAALHAGMA